MCFQFLTTKWACVDNFKQIFRRVLSVHEVSLACQCTVKIFHRIHIGLKMHI